MWYIGLSTCAPCLCTSKYETVLNRGCRGTIKANRNGIILTKLIRHCLRHSHLAVGSSSHKRQQMKESAQGVDPQH